MIIQSGKKVVTPRYVRTKVEKSIYKDGEHRATITFRTGRAGEPTLAIPGERHHIRRVLEALINKLA